MPPPLSPLDPVAASAADGLLPDPPSAEFTDFEKDGDGQPRMGGHGSGSSHNEDDLIDRQEADAKPDPKTLLDAVRGVITDNSDYYQRCTEAYDYRRCYWSGQSDDGRKRAAALGRDPSPWEGASDARIRIIEEICNERAVRAKAAFFAGDMQAQSHSLTSMAQSNAADAGVLLRYVLRTQMQPEIADEVEFASQWQDTFGCALMHMSWDRQQRMEPMTVTVDEMLEAAFGQVTAQAEAAGITDEREVMALAAETVEETRAAILDPANEDTMIAEILLWAPHLTRKQAKAIATELREEGESTYPQPRTAINRPEWTALRPMLDVWFPRETANIKNAAWIARTEWLTLDELRDRVASDGWDADFVLDVQEHRGELFDDQVAGAAALLHRGLITSLDSDFALSTERRDEDYAALFQVVRMYYRAVDAKGFPAIHEVILHPKVPDKCGKYGLLEGAHGEMPFVAFRYERQQRPIIDSRGIPEIAFTHQQEIKAQRDSRTDRTDLVTNPPLMVPRNRGGGRYTFHPGAQIPELRNQKVAYLQPPKMDIGTIEVEQSTMDDLDRMFGRIGKNTHDPVSAQLIQQDAVNNFLNCLTSCVSMTWKMMQQWMSPTTVARVVGGQSNAVKFEREDIDGEYDFAIKFDVRDLDSDFLIKKAEALGTLIIPLDTQGIVDRAQLVKLMLTAVDPRLAEQITKDPQQAAADEAAAEKQALAMMSAGVEPPMIEGQDHQLRLQVLTESLQANEALMQRASGEDEEFAAMVQARVQHHQHMLEQRDNAQIGRVGAAPGLEQV